MDIYLWIILIGTAAGLVQGLSGFGGAALAMPLFTLLMDLQSSVVLVTLLILLIGGLNVLSLPRGNWLTATCCGCWPLRHSVYSWASCP